MRVTDQRARCAENFKNTSQPSQSENRVRERERESVREGQRTREDILILTDGGFSSVCVRETMNEDKMVCWNR